MNRNTTMVDIRTLCANTTRTPEAEFGLIQFPQICNCGRAKERDAIAIATSQRSLTRSCYLCHLIAHPYRSGQTVTHTLDVHVAIFYTA